MPLRHSLSCLLFVTQLAVQSPNILQVAEQHTQIWLTDCTLSRVVVTLFILINGGFVLARTSVRCSDQHVTRVTLAWTFVVTPSVHECKGALASFQHCHPIESTGALVVALVFLHQPALLGAALCCAQRVPVRLHIKTPLLVVADCRRQGASAFAAGDAATAAAGSALQKHNKCTRGESNSASDEGWCAGRRPRCCRACFHWNAPRDCTRNARQCPECNFKNVGRCAGLSRDRCRARIRACYQKNAPRSCTSYSTQRTERHSKMQGAAVGEACTAAGDLSGDAAAVAAHVSEREQPKQ